jgi:hypothetical protein
VYGERAAGMRIGINGLRLYIPGAVLEYWGEIHFEPDHRHRS